MAFSFNGVHSELYPTQQFRLVKANGSHLFLYLDTLANLTVNVRIDMSGVLFNFDQKSPINFSHSGLTFFRSNNGGPVTVSSDTMSLCCVSGIALNISNSSPVSSPVPPPVSPPVSSPVYMTVSDVEILKTRLLALKTEFARLESKWSRLDQFTTDLENFNLVLDGYKNTIPPESYAKLSSVVEKLKAALK